MLQQTQVERVIPFYERWLAALPDAMRCARVGDRRLHRLWQGLGYPIRAERLRACCRQVVTAGGIWPDTPAGLIVLPGIGPYTAGAVACFAFGAAVPVVDTNVARVYVRRDGLPLPVDREVLWKSAADQVSVRSPIAYNNALMELGALVCTAASPTCDCCPWRRRCAGRGDGLRLAATGNPLAPVKARQHSGLDRIDRGRARRYEVYALIHHAGRYLLVRTGGTWFLPGGERLGGDRDRSILAAVLQQRWGAELLAARPFLGWTTEEGGGYVTRHVYRCRVYDPAELSGSGAARWVDPAGVLALRLPGFADPFRERVRRYHRLSPDPSR